MTAEPSSTAAGSSRSTSDEEALDERGLMGRVRWPYFAPVSGRYHWSALGAGARAAAHRIRSVPKQPTSIESAPFDLETFDAGGSSEIVLPTAQRRRPNVGADDTQGVWPLWLSSETIRLDVDGRYPQMTVSGEVRSGLTGRVHWIAELSPTGYSSWEGPIWYRDGAASLMPFTDVRVTAIRSWFSGQRAVSIEFRGGEMLHRERRYGWRSGWFRDVEFEYDRTADANPVTAIGSCAHPNRPPSTRCESLSIDDVFERAGFEVSKSGGDGVVALSGAGSNGTWSDAELHDAMVSYWTQFDDRPQWSMWAFWCALHDRGERLGGIMFDDIGPNHRQGTAIFTEAFISNPPAGDPEPEAWVARMRFWTAVHEMGHSFNLAHAWQKNLGVSWIPLANEANSRSFMNYPFRVAGGQETFFSEFENRFSDQELLFMRHAPARFVQMGNADWFDDHGFEQAALDSSGLRLELRVHRAERAFEFMEPVTLELKLVNDGLRPVLVDTEALSDGDDLTVIIKRVGAPARQWHPYASFARDAEVEALLPGEARYRSLGISAGLNGADLAEPGNYTVQVALEVDDSMLVSNSLAFRVQTPRSWDEEDLAGDFFTDSVNRAMALGGTRAMTSANHVLENVVDRAPSGRAALHARTTLATPRLNDFKFLQVVETDDGAAAPELDVEPADVPEAATVLQDALVDPGAAAAESFGHIELHARIDQQSAALDRAGDAGG
ncbi:MAG: hypothetical protein QNM02_13365, partial [Acidimicrobiia bacterium]|nr:hypothetical protein [Acidimicrobiia bacterium]